MLELSKKILEQVSFDKRLFFKELRKSLEWVKTEEMNKLREWCLERFGNLYRSEIDFVFYQYASKLA